MIYIQLITIWLFVPAIFFAVAVLRVRRLRRNREHELILYALCEARDTMAIKAVRGELDERSETFRYFYKKLSEIVHDHKNHPIGFAHLAKTLAENKNKHAPTWFRQLIRELKKSDPEIKRVVGRYIWAIELVKKQDPLIGLLEALPYWWGKQRTGAFRNFSRQRFLPAQTRQFARFNSILADVVDYCPVEYATATA